MSEIVAVTSYSAKGEKLYGNKFKETFYKHMPKDIMLCVYSEDAEDARSLRLVPGYDEFVEYATKVCATLSEEKATNYRYQAVRFCNKVFSLYSMYSFMHKDQVWWFDADVEFFGTPTKTEIQELGAPVGGVSILNRTKWPHSEGGFIAISGEASLFMNMWRRFYTTHVLFNLREWHDVMAMDVAIALSGCPINNLSYVPENKHVWPDSTLAKFCKHNKGPGRKKDAYGSEISGAILGEINTL